MGAALPFISIGLSVLGAVTTAIGAGQQAKAEQSAANHQAQVARNNAIIAERAAKDALAKGAIEERRQRIRTAQEIGSQRARAAARGVEVDTGSARELNIDTAGLGELDALTVRSNALRESLGFETRAGDFTSEAELALATGRNARQAGKVSAVGSLITGATTVATKWKTF